MMKKIIKCLTNNPQVSDWLINEINTISHEAFYVLQKLETRRVSNTKEYSVTVYHNFKENEKEYTGSSSFIVSHNLKTSEINKLIDDAIFSASFVKNPKFQLVQGEKKKTWKEKSYEEDPFVIIDNVANCFFEQTVPNIKFNSLEIFVTTNQRHIVNSCGIDYQKVLHSIFVESIPSYDGDQKVELYKDFTYSTVDYDRIRNDAKEALEYVTVRYHAQKLQTKAMKVDVILKDASVRELFDNLIGDYSFASVVKGQTNKKIGDPIQKEPHQDILNISLVAPSKYNVFDGDGALAVSTQVVKDGVLSSYYGNNQYACYMNTKSTGNARLIKVQKGKTSIEQMKKKPYIEIIALSGIQIDMYSNYIGGEVRLANYFDGEKVHPISSFSFSGKIDECLNELILSKETTKMDYYEGPKYIKLPKMEIL